MGPESTARGWALVGREDELGLIGRCRDRGDGAVVVTGPSGVGKSRLAREALDRFRRLGAQTRWVQATRSAASVPLGAFAGLLPDSARSEDPLELLRRSAQALRRLGGAGPLGGGGAGPLVLGIDDAQLLDPSSAALVLELTLGGAAFVVLTVRAGEPCPDAVTSVWKDSGATRLELGTLDRAQTEALAEEITGGPIEQSARLRIYQTSLGNPLYVCELTRGALAGGALTQAHGLWRMASRPPVSASLAELIAVRMTGLAALSAHALELLALGEPLPVAELVALAGSGTLADIEARGLAVVSDGTGTAEVSLSHPLYGEAIRAGLPAFRRRQTQLELASSIRERGQVPARDLMRMARWLTEAGEELPPARMLEAAAAANLSGDPALAAELAGRAVAAGAGTAGALLLARAHTLQGRYADAEQVLAAAEEGIGDQATAVDYLELQATVLYWGLRRSDKLGALLARARTWWDNPGWHRQLDTLGLLGRGPRRVGVPRGRTSGRRAARRQPLRPAARWGRGRDRSGHRGAGARRDRAHLTRTAARRPRGAGAVQRRDRRPAGAVGANRGIPPVPGHAQARRDQPPAAARPAEPVERRASLTSRAKDTAPGRRNQGARKTCSLLFVSLEILIGGPRPVARCRGTAEFLNAGEELHGPGECPRVHAARSPCRTGDAAAGVLRDVEDDFHGTSVASPRRAAPHGTSVACP
jgi:hypothetical protein